MYGLTEAFRSTYLDPAQIDKRIDSIGKAIPNAEILVVHPDGTPCDPGETGELVHRGAHVTLGYWNAPEKTAERFRPLTDRPATGLVEEMAVWSGDLVRTDEDGYLYFVGRRDEMIKSSGYRISPNEVETVLYQSEHVAEAAVIGVADPALGQAVVALVVPRTAEFDVTVLVAHCGRQLPGYMVPQIVIFGELPRSPNGKINRTALPDLYQEKIKERGAA
jgi:acyl-CoA synthetase (AMP-forming)/AMP-acid ligase II